MALHHPDPKREEERLAHALKQSGPGHAHGQAPHHPQAAPASGATQGSLYLLSEKEQAELIKQQHGRVKQALEEQAFENDPVRAEQERKKAEEAKKKQQVDSTLDKLAKMGLAPAGAPAAPRVRLPIRSRYRRLAHSTPGRVPGSHRLGSEPY